MDLSSHQDWYQIKDYFYHTGKLPQNIDLDPKVLEVWKTSKASGLSPDSPIGTTSSEPLTKEDLHLSKLISPLLKNIWELFKYQKICTFFINTSFKIIAEKQEQITNSPYYFLKTGSILDPKYFGAIAPSCSILTQKPLIMMGHQHYLNAFSDFSCASVPVFNGQGNILGALDITSFREHLASNWLRHLLYQSYILENEFIKINIDPKHQILYFQHSQDLLKTAYTGLIELDETGRIFKANQMALTLLNTCIEDLLSHPISYYFHFNTPFTQLHHQVGFIRSVDQAFFYAELSQPILHHISTHSTHQSFSLDHHIKCATKILNAGVPILIRGETGTGKDYFAQKIHLIAAANQPFISLNCAAIPEHLLESELFGYEAGAFTGANPKGKKGLVELADKGILFLDEIGDLPLHLQAKLLRILQDQIFYRVGGQHPIRCHFKLISATHQNLTAHIEQQLFRSDLYYRIRGYEIVLPTLKQREDKFEILKAVIAETGIQQWSTQVEKQFFEYQWPGNIRELVHVVQLSAALSDHGYLEKLYLPQVNSNHHHHGDQQIPITHLTDMTKQHILHILEQENGNVSKAAKRLNISRTTLYKYIQS